MGDSKGELDKVRRPALPRVPNTQERRSDLRVANGGSKGNHPPEGTQVHVWAPVGLGQYNVVDGQGMEV